MRTSLCVGSGGVWGHCRSRRCPLSRRRGCEPHRRASPVSLVFRSGAERNGAGAGRGGGGGSLSRPAAAEWSAVGAQEKLVSLAPWGPPSAVSWRGGLPRPSGPYATGERNSRLLAGRGASTGRGGRVCSAVCVAWRAGFWRPSGAGARRSGAGGRLDVLVLGCWPPLPLPPVRSQRRHKMDAQSWETASRSVVLRCGGEGNSVLGRVTQGRSEDGPTLGYLLKPRWGFGVGAPMARSVYQREAWHFLRVRSTSLLPSRASGASNSYSAKRYNFPGADLRARGTLERTRGWTARPTLEKRRRQTRAQVVRGPPEQTPE